jgi:phosphatidylinositol alpha-1,6-mannosyltransferase
MGVLILTWNFPPRRGGIEYLMSHLAAGLSERHPVFVVTSYAQGAASYNDKVFRAPCAGLIPFAAYALWRGISLLSRHPEISVVFGGSVLVTPMVLLLARLFRRKAVVQGHGLDLVHQNFLYQFLCVRWVRNCDRVIANSRYTASLASKIGVGSAVVSVIPPGVDVQRFSIAAEEQTTRINFGLTGRRVVLFVGRLARRKGVKDFINHALPKIVERMPKVCFVIVGDNPTDSLAHGDDEAGAIHAAIAERGLSSYVKFLGALSDAEVVRLYLACDVVVLPALASRDDVEGFGIVLIEAAAAGKPAIATRSGGIPDAIEEGKSGILVDAGDYESLAQAAMRLLGNETLCRAMGEYAKVRVHERFSWERVVAAYETALGLRPPPVRE